MSGDWPLSYAGPELGVWASGVLLPLPFVCMLCAFVAVAFHFWEQMLG